MLQYYSQFNEYSEMGRKGILSENYQKREICSKYEPSEFYLCKNHLISSINCI